MKNSKGGIKYVINNDYYIRFNIAISNDNICGSERSAKSIFSTLWGYCGYCFSSVCNNSNMT